MTTLTTKPRRGRPPKKTPNPAVDFINALHHTGDYHGVPFALRPWQEDDIIRQIFDDSGKARYREVFIALGRKQGKTQLVAAIVNYLLFGTGKHSQEIYSASGDAKQAGLIYDAAKDMIRQSQALSEIAKVYKSPEKRIECNPLNSFYVALSSEHALKYGLRPSVLLFDEMWVFPNRDLFKALTSAFGATKDPLTITITTAGWDRSSLCYEQWKYALGVKDGSIIDPDFLPIIYAADEGDDWREESTWRKSMPALGDFCSLEFIQKACKKAQEIPAYENSFKQLYLNTWTEQAERWLSIESWLKCGASFTARDMVGQPCYAGYDGGVTGDMACLWLVFPTGKGLRVFGHGWAPRDGKWRDEIRNKDRYVEWERQGFLTFTYGNATDERVIKRDVVAFHQNHPFRSMFADRAYSTRLLNELADEEGIEVKGITQGPLTLNEACKLLEESVVAGTIEHDNNPILNWNIANASVYRNATGLMCLDKSSQTERIDGLAALLDALVAYIADPQHETESVYEKRGIIYL